MLLQNGYRQKQIDTLKQIRTPHRRNRQGKPNYNRVVKLPFVSDKVLRLSKNILTKYEIPVQLISQPGRNIVSFNTGTTIQHCTDECYVCSQLHNRYNCRVRFVVYSFSCTLCTPSHFEYIGQTSAWLKKRVQQHIYSIKKENDASALSTHLLEFHSDKNRAITLFTLKVIQKYKDTIDTVIGESIWIERRQPKMNRKFELQTYSMDYKVNIKIPNT